MLLRRFFFSFTALAILLSFPSPSRAQEDMCGFIIETNPPPNSVTVDPDDPETDGHHMSMHNLTITGPNATFTVRAPYDKHDVYLYVLRGDYNSDIYEKLAEHRFDTRFGELNFVYSEFYPYLDFENKTLNDAFFTLLLRDDQDGFDDDICSVQLRVKAPNTEVALCCPPGADDYIFEQGRCLYHKKSLGLDYTDYKPPTICSIDDEGNWQYGYSHFVNLCKQANPDTESHTYLQCIACQNNSRGVWTAIGCIPATAEGITSSIVRFLVAIAGGVALLFLLIGAFTITTSASDPQRLQQGREVITSAIVGLILVVLSLSILQFIGVDILQLPGF